MANEGNSEIDWISELPDEVLCHILSFLPSKEAIATSMLSTRWRSLWTMVPVLNFERLKRDLKAKVNFPFSPEVIALSDQFSFIVNKFLSLRETQRITRFRLKCKIHPCHSTDIVEWVSAAIAGKVENLSISLRLRHEALSYFHYDQMYFSLPNSLFTCSTIVSLNLKGCFLLRVPSSVHLPFLRNLRLNVGMVFNYEISRFLSGCPALEVFYVKRKWRGDELCKRLRMVRNSRVNQLVINEQSLDIAIHGDRCYDYVQDYLNCHLQNVVKASVYITVYENKQVSIHPRVFTLLKELRNVESLSLRDFTEKMEIDPSIADLSEFRNLVRLELNLRDGDSLFLKQIAGKCSNLELLSITVRKDGQFRITEGLWDILPARRV